ncbi:response regulator, partial [bacterium AH-315-C08]|nr:response regulator [bacterium AH-315-C08]
GKTILISNIVKGGVLMGGGVVWMHYTGMAAMKMAGSMHYKPGLFILSSIIAILAATAALGLVTYFGNRERVKLSLKIVAALVMGIAVCGMHYTGMAATVFTAPQNVMPTLQATSDFNMLAFGISGVTLFIMGMALLVSITQREIQSLVESKSQLEKRIDALPKFPEQNPLPVFQVDKAGIIVYANLAAEKALANWNCKMLDTIPIVFQNTIKDMFDYQDSSPLKIDIGQNKYIFDAVYSKDQDRVNLYGTHIVDLEATVLHIERQNFYDMLDNLPICFHLQAPDYSVPYANKMFRERFGDPEDKKCFDLMHRRDQPCEVCSTFKVFDNKEKQTSIWDSMDGHTYLTVCTPFKDSDGKDLVMEMAMDITDQENAKMEALFAKEEAEKANHSKSEFLARMSHELRTPMNAILGFTQLLQMDVKNPLADYQQENMKRVSSAGNHLLELINEVLDLSTVESGKIDLNVETLDLIPIVDNVFSISQSLANEKNISLKYEEIPHGGCFVEIDALRFKQATLNLISNAIKYNKPNGSVIVSYKKQKNGKMRLGIQDTGHGIAEDKMDKIFQPFERFDVDADQIEGTGIGLAISKKVIESMGGTIGFESVAGEGSFFYIDVPVSDKKPVSLEIEIPADSTSESVVANSKKTVLYIENTSVNVDLVRQILTRRPHIELLSAPNALDGIKIAEAITPDLILMDIHLPGMDGLEAFKKLQALDKTEGIPVLALTADAMDGDIKKAINMGFHSYITKPIDVPKFLEAVDKILVPSA